MSTRDDGVLYSGAVTHRRLVPRRHALRYRVFWLLLDLDRIEAVAARLRLFSFNRTGLFSFHERDHGDGGTTPLRAQIERQLQDVGITDAPGRIRLLCMPRIMGYVFNPISIYFCEDRDGRLNALVHQVHNTFGERHSYVLPVGPETSGGRVEQACDKALYVSPFLAMDMRYDFRVTVPGDAVSAVITVSGGDGPVLVAAMKGARRPLSDAALARAFFTVPLATLKVTAGIHWEALKLWAKGVPLVPRPGARQRFCLYRAAKTAVKNAMTGASGAAPR